MFLEAIKKEDFQREVKIRFNNILEGLDKYPNKILAPSIEKDELFKEKEKSFLDFFKEALKINNNNLIIDFYIEKLDDESLKKLLEKLNKEDTEILKGIISENNRKDIYFKIEDSRVIDFIIRLNTRELFFSTFYFIEKPFTIWGNYNLKFPVFYEDKDTFKEYEVLAKKFNLFME